MALVTITPQENGKVLNLDDEFANNQYYFSQFGSYSNFISYIEKFANRTFEIISKKPEVVQYSPSFTKKPEAKYIHNANSFSEKAKMIAWVKNQYQLTRIRYNYYRVKGKYVAFLAMDQYFTEIQRQWLF